MELLAVVVVAFVLMATGYLGVSAVLRRLPAPRLRLPTEPFPPGWRGILERDVPLARGLTAEEREGLLRLAQLFVREKHFEGSGGLVVTEEMKVTIAAQACLLLLHLEGPCYPTLRTVLVYPRGFIPKFARSPHSGEIVSPPVPLEGESLSDGVVVISWEDVIRGTQGLADGENVVLHEFAHQLDTEDGVADGAPVLPRSALRTWGGVLATEYERLRRDVAHGRRSTLDAYGATDEAEFFAVATEAFFEKPVQLERDHPDLYRELQRFYRQDPARRSPATAR
ncbi:MAG TPA: M90 family metallopeptidase [Gemmatimonadales bacterium]|nr:M90 family metallopeptidase [Gemmatimonadales bacterium]